MEVEYGIGVTNRFAFLHEELENEDNQGPQLQPAKEIKVGGSSKIVNKSKVGGDGGLKHVRDVPAAKARSDKKETGPSKLPTHPERKEVKEDRNEGQPRQAQGSRGGQNFRRGGGGGGYAPNNGRFRGRGNAREERVETTTTEHVEKSGISVKEEDCEGNDAKDAENYNDAKENEDEEKEDKVQEERTITLKEWKAMQAPREKPTFNIRRPGEGEDLTRLGKLVPRKKEDEIIGQEEEGYEVDEVYYPQRAGKFKQISEVGFTTGYQKRRGGRGGGRGRFGAGDARETSSEENFVADKGRRYPRYANGGQRRPPPIPRIDDASDFPSLG